VDAGDADIPALAVNLDSEMAVEADGHFILGNLVAFHEVGIGIVLAVELGVFGDRAVQSQSGHHGIFYSLLVDNGQDAGHTQADRAYVRIGRRAGVVRGAAAVHLALR
jgi:hypothetical protein